ncbi:AcrR family transcriptional regulator [Arthrobacter sp. CG_A4]|nr:AcrR family transcriptional regulator [Arthrobacter sp. CG_A4]
MSPSTNSGAVASSTRTVADGERSAVAGPVAPVAASSMAVSGMAASGVRERILAVAYELLSRRGVRGVGVNELISRSGVAKATFYRYFASKDELVLAFLERRDQQWTVDKILFEARRRGDAPEEQLLAIFDVFADWFAREDFEACSFINILLEMGADHPLGRASIDYLAKIRAHVQQLAQEAGLRDPVDFARSWHILMKGSIVSAAEGDLAAAGRARQMAGWLIDHHRG